MRRLLIAAAAAGLVAAATGCSSEPLPASPVPAALSDLQAARLADRYMDARDMRPRMIHSMRPQESGYLVAYQTTFDVEATPPKEWHLVEVRNSGAVRELMFRRDE